jgi:CRP-like cAMP-binding protein
MAPEVFHNYLKKHFVFSQLTNEQVQFIYPYIKFKSVSKGSRIFFDIANSNLYLLLHGKMKLVDCAEPEVFVIKDILYAGEFFGDIFLRERSPSGEFAEVLTNNTIVCYCPVYKVRQLILTYPNLALLFATHIGFKLKRVQKRYLSLAGKDAEYRLTLFFDEWATIEGEEINGKIVLSRSITLEEIAEYIFTSRQTIHTLFKKLHKQGLLQWNRKQFIVDPALWRKANNRKKRIINSAGL